MKSCIAKTAVVALAVSVFSLFGCETVVTDVNAELAAIYPEEDLGIPVKLNENYIEVAYNPSVESEDDTEVKEEIKEEPEDNTETVSESDNTETEDASVPAEDDNDSDDSDNEDSDVTVDEEGEGEDADTSDGEEGEDADTSDGEDTDGEGSEEEGEEDLNASMAEENFDAEFYATAYPDVVAVFGDSPEALYKHYKDYGKAEGRSCNAEEFSLLNESTN